MNVFLQGRWYFNKVYVYVILHIIVNFILE